MKGFSVIPDKTTKTDVISGVVFDIDTKGLDCIIKPDKTDIYVSTESSVNTNEKFLVRQGEELCVCGKFYVTANTAGSVYLLHYKTL